jgi:hypothetical protein
MRTLHVALAATLALGCARNAKREAANENPPYRFPHSVHVDAGLDCNVCHADTIKADHIREQRQVVLPTGDAAQACSGCHSTPPAAPPARKAERTINMSHADHVQRVGGSCGKCHVKLPEVGDARAAAPPMSTCTSCHNHGLDYAQAKCMPCHEDLKHYPIKPVADFRHAVDFLRTHGQMAKTNAATCAQCHEQTSCAECHAAATHGRKPDVQWPEKVGAAFIHRGDYEFRHAMDATADPASCRKCHGSGYCDACHTERGVSQRTARVGRNPHPPSWAAGIVHAQAARQNIVSCAGCHDQGARSTCVSCHRNVNPHPIDWAKNHNKSSDVARNSMCRICHTA